MEISVRKPQVARKISTPTSCTIQSRAKALSASMVGASPTRRSSRSMTKIKWACTAAVVAADATVVAAEEDVAEQEVEVVAAEQTKTRATGVLDEGVEGQWVAEVPATVARARTESH